MFDAAADFLRLAGAAYHLSRYDALLPREYDEHYPLPVRVFAAIARVGAKRTRRESGCIRLGERLAIAFETMSPAYIKFGQLMATRPDIIGFELARDLGRLQDQMPPFSKQVAAAEIERAFSRPFNELFDDFSEPVAAASVAQVHCARLKNGRKVAIKVLRPQIETRVAAEFKAFARFARLIERMVPASRRLEPIKFVETLKSTAAIELDLRMEAAAASAFKDDLKDHNDVIVPAVEWPFTSRRVLTLEWIEAKSIGDIDALVALGIDRRSLARRIIQLFLSQALQNGFFHADMHQGNLMVDSAGRLAFVDFGIMGRLDEKTRLTFAKIIHGFITRDYHRAARVHFDAGYVPEAFSIEEFAQALRAVGEPLFGLSADRVDMSRVLQQLFDVTGLFDMRLRPELVLLQRTMVVVEGVARSLDPEINMWEIATPIVRQSIVEALGPQQQARKMREAFTAASEIIPLLPRAVKALAEASGGAIRPGGTRPFDDPAAAIAGIRKGMLFAVLLSALSLAVVLAIAIR